MDLTKQPPRMKVPDDVVADFMGQCKSTEIFSEKDLEWVESILTRQDGSDGYAQLTMPFVFSREDQGENLYALCKVYNREKEKLTPSEKFEAKQIIMRLLWSKRVSMYRQKKLIVACPQRKQHPKYPTPNLHNFEGAGQHVSTMLVATYGLDYVAARTQCVKQALSDPDATHIMFVDDDVLLPKRAVQILIDSQLPSVAGIYVKKTDALQTTTTTSADDATLIYGQTLVEPKVGDLTPVPASCVAGGMWMIDLDVFRHLPEPWFQMLKRENGGIVIGEDSLCMQKMAAYGVKTHVIPGVIGVHVDFATGDMFAPTEIVDPTTKRIRPELVKDYQSFPADIELRELLHADVVDYFGKNKALKEMGLLK